MRATPIVAEPASGPEPGSPLLEVRNVVQEFVVRGHGKVRGGTVQAVSDVSFAVGIRETLGVVGETGCGKSTLARAILQAPRPKRGEVLFQGQDLVRLRPQELREARRHIQFVAQDPFSSLDPRWRVARLVEEPLAAHRIGSSAERAPRVAELLELVGLDPGRHGPRRPGQLSGGECQRVAIARALALSPQLIICDEAVSSLDVSIQAQILNLFESLKAKLGLSYLFIAHDLAVVEHISDRVAVMYLGKLCEMGPATDLYRYPLHPYTAALLEAVPQPDPLPEGAPGRPARLGGEPPSALNPPSGCRFRTRCPAAQDRCALEEPVLRRIASAHTVACHFPISASMSALRGREEGGPAVAVVADKGDGGLAAGPDGDPPEEQRGPASP